MPTETPHPPIITAKTSTSTKITTTTTTTTKISPSSSSIKLSQPTRDNITLPPKVPLPLGNSTNNDSDTDSSNSSISDSSEDEGDIEKSTQKGDELKKVHNAFARLNLHASPIKQNQTQQISNNKPNQDQPNNNNQLNQDQPSNHINPSQEQQNNTKMLKQFVKPPFLLTPKKNSAPILRTTASYSNNATFVPSLSFRSKVQGIPLKPTPADLKLAFESSSSSSVKPNNPKINDVNNVKISLDPFSNTSKIPTTPMSVKSSEWKNPSTLRQIIEDRKRTVLSAIEGTPTSTGKPLFRDSSASPALIATPQREKIRYKVPFDTPRTPHLNYGKTLIDSAQEPEALKDIIASKDKLAELHESCVSGKVDGLSIQLMDHQREGLAFLIWRENNKSCRGGLLADDMGLGKTLQMIALSLCHRRPRTSSVLEDSKVSAQTLVVVPLALLDQWENEIKKFTHIKVYSFYGKNRNCASVESLKDYDIILTTYDTLRTEHNKASKDSVIYGAYWWRVILDEAHVIKNSKAKVTMACFALSSLNRWCLTGTPLQNKIDELFSFFHFLHVKTPQEIKAWTDQVHAESKASWPKHSPKPKTLELNTTLAEIMLRRKKAVHDPELNVEEISQKGGAVDLKLPPRNVHEINLEFSEEEASSYRNLQRILYEMSRKNTTDNQTNYSLFHVALLRLRQFCVSPRLMQTAIADPKPEDDILADLFQNISINENLKETSSKDIIQNILQKSELTGPSIKFRKMLEILQSYKGEKTIVFTQFASCIPMVQSFFKENNIASLAYTGAMSSSTRTEVLYQFTNDKSQIPVLICSLKCAAVGLNLMQASRVIFLDFWWNPAIENQAIDRVHRIGQTKPVHVYKLAIKNTVDDLVLKLQKEKKLLFDNTIESAPLHVKKKLYLQKMRFLMQLVGQQMAPVD